MGVVFKGFGHFIPKTSVTNAELALRFGITEQYIVEKTGITDRKHFKEGATSDMIVNATHNCLEQTSFSFKDIDCVIVATMTPDYYVPCTASVVHRKLGTSNASGFDIMATCSGYVYALQIASSLINARVYKNILVSAADKFSSIVDPMDKKTALLFADGAGVSLLQYSETQNDVIDTICRLDSRFPLDVVQRTGRGVTPLNENNISEGKQFLRFESRMIHDNAVELFERVISEILKKNNQPLEELDYVLPHQANKRIIESLATKLNMPIEKFIINIENIGNTSAATIPIAISEAMQSGKLKGNKKILLASVGAGYTYAAGLLNFHIN